LILGSGIENWHSILRNGLVNASNTKLMTTGAAYGPGIYAASDSIYNYIINQQEHLWYLIPF
jgi:poly [ADP-ribose] polymerase 6/8